MAFFSPIGRLVGGEARGGRQKAEKRMLSGIDDDPCVSAPDSQVAGLGIGHAAKFVDAGVEVGRGSVGIWESGAGIESVDEVRAIGTGEMMAGVQRGADNGEAFIES